MKPKLLLLVILILTLLVMPLVYAQEEENCGITNLATCIPQKIFEYASFIFSAPLQPLLDYAKSLLSEPVNIDVFKDIWLIIVYVVSIFYGLLFLYAGFNFIVSGHDPVKREKAKSMFRNIFVTIVLVGASFFLYQIVIELSSLLTAGVLNIAPENFFSLTTDNIVNFSLEFFFSLVYLTTLLVTVLLLIIRYIIVCFGVVFLPIGILLYFFDPVAESKS